MAKKLTDDEVEIEIASLLHDPDVQLAKAEQRLLSLLANQTDKVIREINKIV